MNRAIPSSLNYSWAGHIDSESGIIKIFHSDGTTSSFDFPSFAEARAMVLCIDREVHLSTEQAKKTLKSYIVGALDGI